MQVFIDNQGNPCSLYPSQVAQGILDGMREATPAEVIAITNPPISIGEAQTAQVTRLTGACQTAIVSGCQSSALGSPYTYPTDQTSQINMAASVTASVTASLLPGLPSTWTTPFLCKSAAGVWARLPHTAAQIQQAGSDIKAFIVANQNQLDALTAQVNAATTVSAVQAIAWTSPA